MEEMINKESDLICGFKGAWSDPVWLAPQFRQLHSYPGTTRLGPIWVDPYTNTLRQSLFDEITKVTSVITLGEQNDT